MTHHLNSEQHRDQLLLLHPFVHLFPLASFLIAVFAPPDVLSRSSLLASICAVLINTFPFLGWHSALSDFPQVITLVKCISWATLIPSILFTWIALAPARYRGRLRLELAQKKFSKPKLIFVVIASILIAVIGCWFIPNDPAFCAGCTTNSRIGLAIFSYLMLIIPSVMVYLLIVVLYMNTPIKPS